MAKIYNYLIKPIFFLINYKIMKFLALSLLSFKAIFNKIFFLILYFVIFFILLLINIKKFFIN